MKVLFVGLGGIGQRHLRNLRTIIPDLEVGAIRTKGRTFEISNELIPDYNTNIISKYNIKTFASINEAVTFEPDFAVVTNPTSAHIRTVNELVNNKIPAFMEKPISDNYDGLDQLLKNSEENNIPVMIGYMMRFHPCSVKLNNILRDERLGKIYSVVLMVNSYMPGWHKYEKYNEYYVGQKCLGGGVVLTEIHELDLLHWFFGSPKKLSVVGGKLSSLDIDVEDTVSVLCEQEFNENRFPVNISMSFVQQAPYRRMLVFGEFGKIEWDIMRSEIVVEDIVHDVKETYNDPGFERNDMFIKEMEHFIECLSSKRTPITALQNVIDGHLTALKIKTSLEQAAVGSTKND